MFPAGAPPLVSASTCVPFGRESVSAEIVICPGGVLDVPPLIVVTRSVLLRATNVAASFGLVGSGPLIITLPGCPTMGSWGFEFLGRVTNWPPLLALITF